MGFSKRYPSRDSIPERVRELYNETDSGWVFGLDVDGDEVPDLLVQKIEARADAIVSARQAELAALPATIEKTRAELDALRAEVARDRVASAVREAARAEGVTLSAIPDAEALGAEQLAVDSDGNVSTRDGRSVREWVIDRRGDRAHWFPRTNTPPRRLFN